MPKPDNDLGIQGHLNGDADGLGPFRGIASSLVFEGIGLAAFAVFLFFFWR